MLTYEQTKELLKEQQQEQLLQYYDQLNEQEKEVLLRQISNLDFSLLDLLGEESGGERGKLEPLGAVTIDEIKERRDEFYAAGVTAIQQGKVGAVLLAGGQGTRLGYDGPKGTCDIGVTHPLYIFEMLIRNLMQVKNACDAWIPLLIMTSDKNNDATVAFFKEHKFFGYNPEYVFFFEQEMAPSVSYEGKIYLEEKGKVSMSPNGNGGWFGSMQKAGVLDKAKALGVEWLNVFAVDNVLQKMADPVFVGATLQSGCACGAKVVSKADPNERVGVLCLEDGRPSIVEYYEMTDEIINSREPDGRLSYNYGVILNYLFRVDALEAIAGKRMPTHVVEKKIPHLDDNGNLVKPESPNGYKFETLVLDMIHMMPDCLSFEVDREKEFAPIKNKTGVDSIESARALLEKNGITL
ncbi:MAG: UDPGP type 1 family protein [Clostridia bacterium]|nr:UDPGP type 1 family protein [Clostridia bacterium]